MTNNELIVVGVDGSEESRAALRWSADEAVARGARLEVVCAWDLPFSGLATSYAPGPVGLPDAREVARRAENALDQTLREVLADDAPLEIERVVEAGDPATVLLGRLNRIYGVARKPDPKVTYSGNYGFILD